MPAIFLTIYSTILTLSATLVGHRRYGSIGYLFALFIASIYSLFLAVRPSEFGTDTIAYINAYDRASGILNFEINNNFEFGYNIVMSISKSVGFGFGGFVFFVTLFSFWILIHYTYKFKVNPVFVICFLLVSSTALSLYTNVFRQGLSLCFVVAASYYIFNRKIILFLFFSFLAASFHITSLPFLFFLLFAYYSKKVSFHLSVFLIILVSIALYYFFFLNASILLAIFEYAGYSGKAYQRLKIYLSDDYSVRVGVGVFLSSTLLAVSAYILSSMQKYVKGDGRIYYYDIFYFCFMVCVSSLIFYIVFSSFGVLARIYAYSIYFEGVLVCLVFAYFFRRTSFSRVVAAFLFFLVAALKLIIPVYLS